MDTRLNIDAVGANMKTNARPDSDIVDAINDLIETCKDGELGFIAAMEDTKTPNLKVLFTKYSTQRAAFASQLQEALVQTGYQPEESGSLAGTLHRGWINLKSAVSGREDKAILEECERGEEAAVKEYQRVLGEFNLPGPFLKIVEQQQVQVRAAHNAIEALRAQQLQ